MTIACIIGNGASRKDVDLNKLKKLGTIFGCNALYRDFEPDWLVAIDPKMIEEIRNSNFDQTKFIVPKEERHWEPPELYGRTSGPTPRSNAGMVAMLEAIDKGYDTLFCLGFDFLVVNDDIALSNVYDGTDCYGPETRAVLRDTRNRIKFLIYVIARNPFINFIFAYPEGYQVYFDNVFDNVHLRSIDNEYLRDQ